MYPQDFLELRRMEFSRCNDRINRNAWKFQPLATSKHETTPASVESRRAHPLRRVMRPLTERRPSMTPAVDLC